MQSVKTTCPYCGVGCGLEVTVADDGDVTVRGDKAHPANLGRLCSKGAALGSTLDMSGRLLQPEVGGEVTDWDSALDHVAHRFNQCIEDYGPDSVAFYVSGQLLTEDYYVANKLMKGFIGSANIDTNSRLCMSSSVVGHKRAFGSDTVPGCYEDWEQCDLIVLTGSNTAWCHPVLYQRLAKAKKDRPSMKVVVIDPRKTATCDIADLHLPLKSGTDAYLFTALLSWLESQNLQDTHFIENFTQGFQAALAVASNAGEDLQQLAETCGLGLDLIKTFFQWYGETEKTITVYSQGINQSSSGSNKVNAIINCHLMTGRIGKPGMGPFSVTGQPNAMGGREVGALSNQLAAHMDYANEDDVDRVSRFWSAQNMSTKPGLKAIDLFQAVGEGRIKALWIMATNPAASMPDAKVVQKALQHCDFVVVSDCVAHTDTTAYANVLLPAQAWGEKSGTITNSERRISRQRPFLPTPDSAQPDWWIVSRVARRMGFSGFDYNSPHEIFTEHAELSAYENDGQRDFDLTGLVDLEADEYDQMPPQQWPVYARGMNGKRLFSDGRFFTDSHRAAFVTVDPELPRGETSTEYPLVLNTGRVRDQWHTMTRTGKSPRLNHHMPEPVVQVHPQDAWQYQLPQGALAEVASQHGIVVLRVEISDSMTRGNVFVPMHWNLQNSSSGSIGQVVNPHSDPYSGQPEFKHTPVHLKPYKVGWYGYVMTRRALPRDISDFWTRSWRQGFWHYQVSGIQSMSDWASLIRSKLSGQGENESWSELLDSSGEQYRAARFTGDQLDVCLFVDRTLKLPSADWVESLFELDSISRTDRLRILSAVPASAEKEQGKVVCSCFNVGENKICESIKKYGLSKAEQVGEHLQAGTNCGSCIPEINALIQSV